jgi:hypothetical protein
VQLFAAAVDRRSSCWPVLRSLVLLNGQCVVHATSTQQSSQQHALSFTLCALSVCSVTWAWQLWHSACTGLAHPGLGVAGVVCGLSYKHSQTSYLCFRILAGMFLSDLGLAAVVYGLYRAGLTLGWAWLVKSYVVTPSRLHGQHT